jgi:hypothetical protein
MGNRRGAQRVLVGKPDKNISLGRTSGSTYCGEFLD